MTVQDLAHKHVIDKPFTSKSPLRLTSEPSTSKSSSTGKSPQRFTTRKLIPRVRGAVIIITVINGELCVAMVLNYTNGTKYADKCVSAKLAIPGGSAEPYEPPGIAAMRELFEETGMWCVGKPLFLQHHRDTTALVYTVEEPFESSGSNENSCIVWIRADCIMKDLRNRLDRHYAPAGYYRCIDGVTKWYDGAPHPLVPVDDPATGCFANTHLPIVRKALRTIVPLIASGSTHFTDFFRMSPTPSDCVKLA